jgi:hypothetical protein
MDYPFGYMPSHLIFFYLITLIIVCSVKSRTVHILITSAIFRTIGFRTHRVAHNTVGEWECYIDTQKKTASERRSGLRPSEKEITERPSDGFRHKNTRLLRIKYH